MKNIKGKRKLLLNTKYKISGEITHGKVKERTLRKKPDKLLMEDMLHVSTFTSSTPVKNSSHVDSTYMNSLSPILETRPQNQKHSQDNCIEECVHNFDLTGEGRPYGKDLCREFDVVSSDDEMIVATLKKPVAKKQHHSTQKNRKKKIVQVKSKRTLVKKINAHSSVLRPSMKVKQKWIAQQNTSGIRRSQRAHVPALAYWLGERITYVDGKDGKAQMIVQTANGPNLCTYPT